jgi:hypothetical protein
MSELYIIYGKSHSTYLKSGYCDYFQIPIPISPFISIRGGQIIHAKVCHILLSNCPYFTYAKVPETSQEKSPSNVHLKKDAIHIRVEPATFEEIS